MSRILAIDYGKKRTGLAVTDPLQIIASPLDTIPTHQVLMFIKKYHADENLVRIVIGMPKDLFNNETDSTSSVIHFINLLKKELPSLPIHEVDERFTSKIAKDAMLAGGMKKRDRRKKENVDKLSATLILQSFLESNL